MAGNKPPPPKKKKPDPGYGTQNRPMERALKQLDDWQKKKPVKPKK